MRRSLRNRLILSHLAVTLITSGIALNIFYNMGQSSVVNRQYSYQPGVAWLIGQTGHIAENPVANGVELPGSAVVLAADGRVLLTQGETDCRAGMNAADCDSSLMAVQPGERTYAVDGVDWWEVRRDMPTGDRIITRRQLFVIEPRFSVGSSGEVHGFFPVLIANAVMGAVQVLPIAVIAALLLARWQTRRLKKLAHASRQYAQGNFDVRVQDQGRDMIGRIGLQFNRMADALHIHLGSLRASVRRNAELIQRVEESARTAERARVTRTLHDTLAQDVFKLSLNAAELARAIDQDPHLSEAQADTLAAQAEAALLRLRRVLIELRPAEDE